MAAKVGISVPDQLRQQMKEFPELNWSQICADAIQTEIDLQRTKREVSMEAAGLERLRNSRQQHGESNHARGIAIGKQWALETAEFDELEAVAELAWPDDLGPEHAWGILTDAMIGVTIEEFWDSVIGEDEPKNGDLIYGFIAGAKEVYEQV